MGPGFAGEFEFTLGRGVDVATGGVAYPDDIGGVAYPFCTPCGG